MAAKIHPVGGGRPNLAAQFGGLAAPTLVAIPAVIVALQFNQLRPHYPILILATFGGHASRLIGPKIETIVSTLKDEA